MALAESATSVVVNCPAGTRYSIADAPTLWFWASYRSVASKTQDDFLIARQVLLERDVFRDKLTDRDSQSAPARPS